MSKSQSKPILLKSIYATAEKLGADVGSIRSLPGRIVDCPDFIAEFYQHITWPRRHQFVAADYDDTGLTGISFSAIQSVPPEQGVIGAEGKELYAFGMHNGGNWILVFDGNETRKQNPMVYCVDHEPGSALETMCRLNEFLKMLSRE